MSDPFPGMDDAVMEIHALKPEEIVNLDDYPIGDSGAPEFITLTRRLKRELDAQQYVLLPDFMRPAARRVAVKQLNTARPLANHNCSERNCYLQRSKDPSLPDDHARNILLRASNRMLAADLLPDDSPLKTLYYWDNFKEMVATIVGEENLYVSEDPCQPVNALCYESGDCSAWHFDSYNAFTMTLMLQAPEHGGRFEIIPNIRGDNNENYGEVRDALLGQRQSAKEVAREEGALCIFRGCNSLHRVSEVGGERLRIMGVFVYENEPGVVGDPEVNETIYGRRGG